MNTLKAISSNSDELRVGNYIIMFGGKDLSGEHFTKNTKIESAYTRSGVMYVDFEHGYDVDGVGNDDHNILGVVDWKTAKVDDAGIFVQRVLDRRAEYVKYLEELIAAGLVGTSSEAAYGMTKRAAGGEITEWPLMRDSLTVTPCEPRMLGNNALVAVKSLVDFFPRSKSLILATGGTVADEDTIEDITDLKSAEAYLRGCGLSRQKSKTFVSRIKSLGQRDADDGAMKGIIEALKKRGATLPV